ncbi:MAG: hypothetical protein HY764_02035 [Candidatus Portnoybacteria bacterium]|nr:hypothetical protein [Candidatus Portnoybacteria bacterium]
MNGETAECFFGINAKVTNGLNRLRGVGIPKRIPDDYKEKRDHFANLSNMLCGPSVLRKRKEADKSYFVSKEVLNGRK